MKKWIIRNGYEVMRLLPGRCNIFAVAKDGKFVLVDTSIPNVRRRLIRIISNLRAEGYAFDALVLTHAHFDHAGNAAAVAKVFDVPVLINGEELGLLCKGENAVIRGVMDFTRLVNRVPVQKLLNNIRYEPVLAAIAMDSTMDLALFGLPGVTILPTPGHTSGSISILVDDEIALVGDAMHGVFPGNAWPPFAEDESLLLQSWGRLLETGCTRFLPSHGGERSRSMAEGQYRLMRKNSAARLHVISRAYNPRAARCSSVS